MEINSFGLVCGPCVSPICACPPVFLTSSQKSLSCFFTHMSTIVNLCISVQTKGCCQDRRRWLKATTVLWLLNYCTLRPSTPLLWRTNREDLRGWSCLEIAHGFVNFLDNFNEHQKFGLMSWTNVFLHHASYIHPTKGNKKQIISLYSFNPSTDLCSAPRQLDNMRFGSQVHNFSVYIQS